MGIDRLSVSVQCKERLNEQKGYSHDIRKKDTESARGRRLRGRHRSADDSFTGSSAARAPAPGTFIGADLITENAEAASRSYADLFGWDVEKVADGGYRINHKGRLIASISQIDASDGDAERSFWLVALAVNDLKQAMRSAAENNAEVYEKVTTVKKYGKFAVIGDSEKAPVMFIQSGKTPIGGTTGPGSWVWAELWTDDIDKATTFYADVVGVGHDTTDRGGRAYHLFTSQGEPRTGIVKIPAELEDVKPGWAPYVDVEDLDTTKAKVKSSAAGSSSRRRIIRRAVLLP